MQWHYSRMPQNTPKFIGSMVALITPFKEDFSIDWPALEKLIEWHITQGTQCIIPCGTTGESATLSNKEHFDVVKFTVQKVAGRIQVMAGTGSNNTAEAIEFTTQAQEAGADAALVITPYYNKPTQPGLLAHFTAIHDATNIPIILYDVPARTVTRIHDATLIALAKLPRIKGLKDATANLERPLALYEKVPEDFALISGEDATALAFYAQGGHGCISVSANVAPKLCRQQYDLWQEGKAREALEIARKVLLLHEAMFCETSPAPAKYALSKLGFCKNIVRLPLTPVLNESKSLIDKAISTLQ